MKWKVEYITENSTNILIDDPSVAAGDEDAVAMAFPNKKLAERIVTLHNEAIENIQKNDK